MGFNSGFKGLKGDERSDSNPDRFNPAEFPVPMEQEAGLVPQSEWTVLEKEKESYRPSWESNWDPSVVYPVA